MITITYLRKSILEAYRSLPEESRSWKVIGDRIGISSGMAYRIANDSYDPKDPQIRAKLCLPSLVSVPICAKCGEVHVSKKCTHKSRSRWSDYSIKQLRSAIINRVEI